MAALQFSKQAAASMGSGRSRKSPGKGSSSPVTGIFSMVNLPLMLVVIILLAIGMITLYSVTLTDSDYSILKQGASIFLGIAVMVVFWVFDYRRLSSTPALVALMLIILFSILLPMTPLGLEVNGARSWVKLGSFQFQPSELAKPLTIIMLAAYVSRFGGNISRGKDYLKCLAMLVVPFALLAKEDLGTGLVVLIIGFSIFFVGGLKRRWIVLTVLVCALGVAGLLALNGFVSDWTGGEKKLIKDYQMSRLLVFIDQDNPDYADDAYNLNQAKIAVGSGEVTGKGWGNATQSSGGFLPESATDFIFCVYAEEFGFIGAVVLLALYLALLVCALAIGFRSGDLHGALMAAGIMGMWLFQVLENIGMDIGLMPITGIPLPFMSYGGSFMIINFICVGLLLSVWARRDASGV